MGDAELRALERDVAVTGSREARVRYAAALERAGREAEALAVLTATPGDPALRGPAADLGARLAAAERLPAVRRAPVVAWERKLELPGAPRGCLVSVPAVYGTSLVVVCVLPWNAGVVALDARTGAIRWRTGREMQARSVVGPVFVCEELERPDRAHVVARDLWTGDVVWSAPGRTGRPHWYAPGLVVCADGRTVHGFGWPDPSRPPDTRATFSTELELAPGDLHVCAPGAVVVEAARDPYAPAPPYLAVLDPRSGGVRFTLGSGHSFRAADASGLLVRVWGGPGEGFALYDVATGALAWRYDGPLSPKGVLSRGTVVGTTRVGADARTDVLERSTGRLRFSLPGRIHDVAVAQGTLYVRRDQTLAAVDAESGAVAWEWTAADVELSGVEVELCGMATLPDRVVVCSHGGLVTCLAEPTDCVRGDA